MTSKRKKKPSKARKGSRGRLPIAGMPQDVIDAVRAIRSEKGSLIPERGPLKTEGCTSHGTECSICGELGEHACLPILHEAIESSSEFAEKCWEAFKALEAIGYFQLEDGAGKTVPLEDLV